jgi:hypothetical protein
MLRHTISASTLCLLLASASPAMGQPAPEAPISAAQMLARLAPLGNIQAKVFPRETGERSLRIYLSVPAGKAPEQGWPVLYMLDGNATLLAVADAIAHARGVPNGSPSIRIWRQGLCWSPLGMTLMHAWTWKPAAGITPPRRQGPARREG